MKRSKSSKSKISKVIRVRRKKNELIPYVFIKPSKSKSDE